MRRKKSHFPWLSVAVVAVLACGTAGMIWAMMAKVNAIRERAKAAPAVRGNTSRAPTAIPPKAKPAASPSVAIPEIADIAEAGDPPTKPPFAGPKSEDLTDRADGRVVITARVVHSSMHVDDWLSGTKNPRPLLEVVFHHAGRRVQAACTFPDPAGPWYYSLGGSERIRFTGQIDSAWLQADGSIYATVSDCEFGEFVK